MQTPWAGGAQSPWGSVQRVEGQVARRKAGRMARCLGYPHLRCSQGRGLGGHCCETGGPPEPQVRQATAENLLGRVGRRLPQRGRGAQQTCPHAHSAAGKGGSHRRELFKTHVTPFLKALPSALLLAWHSLSPSGALGPTAHCSGRCKGLGEAVASKGRWEAGGAWVQGKGCLAFPQQPPTH